LVILRFQFLYIVVVAGVVVAGLSVFLGGGGGILNLVAVITTMALHRVLSSAKGSDESDEVCSISHNC